MVALRGQGNWKWEGPLGTPLGLVHWNSGKGARMLHIVMENNPSTLNLHILFKGVKNAFPASARGIQVSTGTWVRGW